MSGGGFRGRSFGQHGARYNNSRSGGRDDGGGSGVRSRRDNERNSRGYSRENFDNSSSSSRRSGRSQNENWSGPRSFTRWDQPSNNRQSSPSSPSSSSSTHNQSSSWSRNCGEHYQNSGSLRFSYRNDSQQFYNRGGRGYFARGGYRFSNQKGPQNFFSPYYSAPFRENIYDQHEKDPQPDEPATPLLGSEEERQQKITEAADELKRKLLCTSATNDDVDATSWEDHNTPSESLNLNDESNIIKSVPELRHSSPGLHTAPNSLENISALNDSNTIFPIKLFDCMQVADIDELTPTACNNIRDIKSVDTNLIVMPTTNVDISDKGDKGINREISETSFTVDTLNISEDPAVHVITESFNELATASSEPVGPTIVVKEYPTIHDEPVQLMITDEVSNSMAIVADTSRNIETINTGVPDLAVTNSPITESLNITDNNQKTFDMNVSSENTIRRTPFLTNFTVHDLPKRKELNLIEYLQKQVGLPKSKSPVLSNEENEKTIDIYDKNKGRERNDQFFSTASNHSLDNNSQYVGTRIGNHDFSEPDILQPPPLPPVLPPPSYESELCLNAIVPEFDSIIIHPSNISSPCDPFHQSSTFNIHLPAIPSPIMSTAPVVNPSMNITTPMSSYVMSHQSYVPITPYGPSVSLAYPSLISALDYTTQTVVPPPLPLSHSPPIQSLILQDVCASNVNEDDDVLDELKEAMEFAKKCMVMGNEENEPEEEDIEFSTFPDLPPVMPMTLSPEKPKNIKKNSKTKKVRQGMFGAHLKAIAEAKKKSMSANVVPKTNVIVTPDETTADCQNRRKVVFNLNSKCRVINKHDGVWLDESPEEVQTVVRNKWKRLTPIPVVETEAEKPERDGRTKKTRETGINQESVINKNCGINKESEKTKVTEKIKESERLGGSERIRESGKSKASEKTKESEKSLKRDDKNEKNHNRKTTDSNRASDKNRRDPKKKINKPESSSSNNNTRNKIHSSPTKSRKLEKTNSDQIIIISEQHNDTQAQSSSANKSSFKTTTPKSLTESTWKDRVIGRFLKMSKNDIQNMINNSSLRKFDIAMQHLVKEKKSSLSLEMRNHEDEKMKTSTYDSEDFMSQLQAILDPAATVDITDLPTNFIHQLSEVLHLDPAPAGDAANDINAEKKVDSVVPSIQEPSTSTKIDPKMTSESSRLVGTNTPVISAHDMPKSRKIDNRVSKDTVKNTSSPVLEVATCARTKAKRGQIDNVNVQRNTNQVTLLSASLSSSLEKDDEINVDEHDNLIEVGVAPAKTIETPLYNIESTTPPPVINKTPTVVIERILLTDTTPTSTTTITTTTSPTLSRIETSNVTRIARSAVELDKLFIAGIPKPKAESSSSTKTTAVASTIDETLHDTRTRKLPRHGIIHGEIANNMWQRKDADDVNICRNMTKDEYEIHYGEPIPHPSYEAEYRKIAAARSRKNSSNGREVISHPMHIDVATLCGSHSPSRVPPQILPNQMEISNTGSDSQCDSDTSSSSSSGSNSEGEPSLLDVTKVLKFIKQREKMAKRKTINEEIRDEVAAEIEKHRREKNVKHKSHKSRSKKRDKRKKERKVKKKKPKKKRRRKTHHLPHSGDNTVEQDELPLRLLADDEIKREIVHNEPQKATEEESKFTIQTRRSTIPATKISTESVIPALINKSVGTETTTSTARDPFPNDTTTIAPTISSTPALITSTYKPNPISNSPSLIVTVVNTSIANANASASSAIKAALISTATSPLRTVTAVTPPCSTTPQSPILQPKTKAQLKQMPELLKTTQNLDTKIVETTTSEPNIVEPVSSTSENRILSEPEIPSAHTSSISTTIATTHTGPKKLDIKTYHERALRRKLKEEERMKNLVENPTQLTQNLLVLPVKHQLPPVDDASSCVNLQPKTSGTNTPSSSIDQPNTVVMAPSSNVTTTPQTRKLRRVNSKLTNISPEKSIVSPTRRKLDQLSTSNIFSKNLIKEDIKTIDTKFINIKSEGGKELKLREKVKKRPHKAVAPPTIASTHTDAALSKKATSTVRNRRKNLSIPVDASENIRDVIRPADNIEVAIDESLLSANIPTNDTKDNLGDINPCENIETDAIYIVQRETVPETNEHLQQINDVVMADEKLLETNESIRNSGHISCEQTSNRQSESIEKKFSVTEYQEVISTFSHYFELTKGLISDGLPDTVAQERMPVGITTKVPEIIEDEKIMEPVNNNVMPNKSTFPEDNENITTESIPGVNSLLITSGISKNVSMNNDGLQEDLKATDNIPEEMEPTHVSGLFNDDFNDAQSLPSTSFISDTNIHSPLTVSTVTTELMNSREAMTAMCKSPSSDLLGSAQLSNVDTTISSTYPLLQIGCNRSQNYDQLTLDDLSDISMDESTLSDHKDLSQTSVADTVLLSETQNNVDMVNLLGKDTLFMVGKKKHDKLTNVENEMDDWDDRNDEENNLIPENMNNIDLPQDNGIPISDDTSLPNDCYKEYSQQSVVLHDRVLSMEEPRNVFLDDPITFSNTKSPTPEPIEYGVLGDNDVMSESIYDDHRLEQTSSNNTLSDVTTNDEEVPDSFTNASLNNSRQPPPLSSSLTLDDNIVHSSSFPDKELIKAVEGTSPERLPSPILEVSSKLIEDDDNDDSHNADNANDIGIDDGPPRVDEEKSRDYRLEEETAKHDIELITENCVMSENVEYVKTSDLGVNDTGTNKLLDNTNQPVMESPTSTTRIIETNSFGRDESERSSSESRSIEQDRTQSEMSFTTSMPQEKCRHKRRERDHYSSRKSSSSKSSTPTLDHKKHKKHNHDRKKHKLTLKLVEEAIAANITNLVSNPTTKDDVMSRMQEIDIAIQRLMNEKMQLYQMLQTDEWPVNHSVETLNEPFESKTKSRSLSGKIEKTFKAKEPRVVVSRLAETGKIKRSTMSETSTSKSQNLNTQKTETPKTFRTTVKSDDKHPKQLDGNCSKESNKRKYLHDQKESHKSKEIKKDGSPVAKKHFYSAESSRDKNKSPPRAKNPVCAHRKPIKLSQMLAREFKPKVNVEKHRSVSPTIDHEVTVPKLHSRNEQKIAHSTTTETFKPSPIDHESSDETNSRHFVPPKNIALHNNHNDPIYSDESSWDVTDHSTTKHVRSTGLSLLEQSIKREIAAKKIKSTEVKTKLSSKSSKDESLSTDPEAESTTSSRLTSKRKQQRKKHQENNLNKTPNKTNNHVLEVIDAVAKNCINDLYTNAKTLDKKSKTPKKSEKSVEMDENYSNIGSEARVNEEEVSIEKTTNPIDVIREVVESPIPLMSITSSLSPLSVSQNGDEYNSDANNHDAREWASLDLIEHVDEKDESNSKLRENTLEKNKRGSKKIQGASLDYVNYGEQADATQQHPDIQHDKNMDIKSTISNDNVDNEKADELRYIVPKADVRKEILDDWQDSPNISQHELNHSHNDNVNAESIALEEIAGHVILLPIASTIVNADIRTKDHKLPVIEKSVIVDSTPTTTIKLQESCNLEEKKLEDDSITKKIVIGNLVIDESSIRGLDSKSKRSKSVGKNVEKLEPTVEEVERSKLTGKEIERAKLTVVEIDKPKSTVKELEKSKSTLQEIERSQSTVRELERSKSAVKEIERPKSTVEEIERSKSTVKTIERPKSIVKELERSKSSVNAIGRPKSTVEELEKSKLIIEEIERPKSTVKELDRPKSAVRDLEKSKSTVKEIERPKSTVKELGGPKSRAQELERSKSTDKESERMKSTVKEGEKSKSMPKESEKLKSTVKEQRRPKATVKDLDRSKSTVKETEKPKSTVKEFARSKSTVKELERMKSTVKEIGRSKSTVKDNERPKSTVEELDRPNSAVKELDRPTSIVKELDRPNSTVKELEQSRSMLKELERSKSTVKEIDGIETPDHNDNDDDDYADHDDDDESTIERRERPAKRRRRISSRQNSRQSDNSFKTTSRSRSHSKRTTKSPSSRDGSAPDDEQRARPTSGSSSSSTNARRRSNTASNTDIKTNDKNNTVRRGRKRKIPIERTREQMANCKVRLVDCKNLYLRSDSRSDILQRLGISRINAWTPSVRRDTTPERPASKMSSIIVDEDKNRSDDESMEIIQVDDNMDLQSITSAESSADIMIRDPLSITPRASPQYNFSPHIDDTTTIVDIANENEDEEDAGASSDYVEVLETRTVTPVNNPTPSEKKNDDELQTMQYTVHKGPILDIKVFGDSFLAASEDGSIYRYCQRSNGILNIYKGHEAAVTCLYVHEVPGTADNGNIRWNLFSGSLDATLRCYDIINGSLDRHIADVGSPIQCMDQAWGMIFIGTKSGHISRYDIKSGCLREDNLDFSDKPVLALRASTEGVRRVLIVASRNQPITIRDAQNGLYLRTISGQRTHTVYSLMQDRNLVYCGTSSTSIPVFDFISGEQVIQYTAGVGIVCMRLYRQLLFAGCYDGNIYVFDTKDTKLICSIPGPGNMLLSMEIVDDKIIAGSKDRRLHAWRMPVQARTILAERA